MDEDSEIELLFESNKKILLEASNEINSEDDESNKKILLEASNEIHSEDDDDSELEILLESNKKILLETSNEINSEDDLDESALDAVVEAKSSHNQELAQEQEVNNIPPQFNNPEEVITVCDKVKHRELDCNLKTTSDALNTITETLPEDDYFESAGEQVNEHVLDLLTTDPYKYFLRHFEREEDDDDLEDDDDDDNDGCLARIGEKSDVFEYQDIKCDNYDLKETKMYSSSNTYSLGSDSIQKQKQKAISKLTALGNMILKRNKFLIELKNKLIQSLNEIKTKLAESEEFLEEAERSVYNDLSSSRCYFRRFGMPYFSDSKGFYAPPNKDCQQKLENDELMIESIPKINRWTKEQKILLETAIKENLIATKSEILTKEINQMKKELKKTWKGKKHTKNNIVRDIAKKQNDLKQLYKQSLKELVEGENETKDYDWMKFSVSLFNGDHSGEECKKFWNFYLKPSINKGQWSDEEDKKLVEIAKQMKNQDWDNIAKKLGTNRSAFQCFVHYKARLEEENHKSSGKWSKKEDAKLLSLINSAKMGNFIPWAKVSSHMANRNQNQVYTRWSKTLNPEIVKGKFTKDEDLFIVAGIEVFGVTFKQLATYLNHRTSSQLRERYERYLLPKTTKVGCWSLEEDKKLLKLVHEYGACNWSKISKEMKTRSRTQVRQRYGFIQKMMKKDPNWTVAQVKRRKGKQMKSLDNTEKNVQKIKKHINKLASIFNLSELEKETFLLEKLEELRRKVFSKNPCKRVRKKIDLADQLNPELNRALTDFFTICHHRSSNSQYNNSLAYDFDSNGFLNVVFLLKKFIGLRIELPNTPSEIRNNQRLGVDLKNYLKTVLNNNPNEVTSRAMVNYSRSNSQAHVKILESTQRIDYSAPENDDTIIMMDWWHTPPVDITRLNFSEFFKRTVFDYSYGMHKDIWDSKVKRHQQNYSTFECSSHIEKTVYAKHEFFFPPTLSISLGLRSSCVSQAILKILSNDLDIVSDFSSSFIKKEVKEETNLEQYSDIIHTLSKQYQNILLRMFTWPHILSVNNIVNVPYCNDQSARKILKNLRGKVLMNCTKMSRSKITSKENNDTSLITNCNDFKMTKKRKMKANDACRMNKEAQPKVKRRKSVENPSVRKLIDKSVKEGKCGRKKNIRQTCGKRKNRCSLQKDSILKDKTLFDEEMPQKVLLPSITYSKRKQTQLEKAS